MSMQEREHSANEYADVRDRVISLEAENERLADALKSVQAKWKAEAVEVERLKAELEDEHEIAENYHRQHSCADCGSLVCPPLRCMSCLSSGERNAKLEIEVERLRKAGADAAGDAVVSHKACDRLEEELASARQKHKEDAAQIVKMMSERRGWSVIDKEKEIERLNSMIKDWIVKYDKLRTEKKHEDAERCAIITKLGRRLGCLKKRRKKELEELRIELVEWRDDVAQVMKEPCDDNKVHCPCVPVLRHEVERLKNILRERQAEIRKAYENGSFDTRHAHAVIAAHAAPKPEKPCETSDHP